MRTEGELGEGRVIEGARDRERRGVEERKESA